MAQPTNSTPQANIHPTLHAMHANVLAFGAVGDGTTDDAAAITAAIAASPTVYFPPGYTFKHTTTLVPATASRWEFGGMRGYSASTGGSALKYTGSGKAIDCTNKSLFEISDGKVECTNNAAIALYLSQTDFVSLNRVSLTGPGGGTSYGIKAEGEAGCQCHNTFSQLHISGFNTGVSLSGDSNANEFINCYCTGESVAISLVATGSDTTGGDDNLFERFELTAGGIVIGANALRNVFLKCVEDGSFTSGLNITTSSAADTVFMGCSFQGTYTNSGTRTLLIGCTGSGLPTNAAGNIVLGTAVLYGNAGETNVSGWFKAGASIARDFGNPGEVRMALLGGKPGVTFGSAADVGICSGSGTPEGAVTANVGSIYLRTNGGALTSFYVKETGAGNTGWVAK